MLGVATLLAVGGKPTDSGGKWAPWDLQTALNGGPTQTEVKQGDVV